MSGSISRRAREGRAKAVQWALPTVVQVKLLQGSVILEANEALQAHWKIASSYRLSLLREPPTCPWLLAKSPT